MAMRAPYAPAYAGGAGGGGGPSRGPMSPPGMQPMGAPQSAPAPAAAPPHKGTLAPGTRVQVGALAVVVVKYLAEGGFAHVYLVRSSQPLPLPAAAGAPPGAEYTHVLKRIAVPDKEALAIVRGEVEVHVSGSQRRQGGAASRAWHSGSALCERERRPRYGPGSWSLVLRPWRSRHASRSLQMTFHRRALTLTRLS